MVERLLYAWNNPSSGEEIRSYAGITEPGLLSPSIGLEIFSLGQDHQEYKMPAFRVRGPQSRPQTGLSHICFLFCPAPQVNSNHEKRKDLTKRASHTIRNKSGKTTSKTLPTTTSSQHTTRFFQSSRRNCAPRLLSVFPPRKPHSIDRTPRGSKYRNLIVISPEKTRYLGCCFFSRHIFASLLLEKIYSVMVGHHNPHAPIISPAAHRTQYPTLYTSSV